MKKKQKTFTVAEAARYLRVSRQALNTAVIEKRIKSRQKTIEKVVRMKVKVTILDKADLDKFKVSRSHQQRGRLVKTR